LADDCLLVFLKRPRPGEAKTRLVPQLGAECAAALYRALAEEEVRRTTPRPGDYDRLFLFAPADAGPEMELWFPGQEWLPQEGDDLGARMAAAFEQAFRRGARRAALIGSDAPWVSRDRVLEALAALQDHDVALGPARDGGYYLIALDRPRPGLFGGIRWSSSSVLAATVERAGALGLGVRLLESLPDIDTLADLRDEWPRLRPLLAARPELVAAIEASLAGPS
jgi:rSAM/selenodomain-associated transferase 1